MNETLIAFICGVTMGGMLILVITGFVQLNKGSESLTEFGPPDDIINL